MAKQRRSYSMYDIKTRAPNTEKWVTLVAGILKPRAANKYYQEYVTSRKKNGAGYKSDFKLIKLTVTERTVRTTAPLKKATK